MAVLPLTVLTVTAALMLAAPVGCRWAVRPAGHEPDRLRELAARQPAERVGRQRCRRPEHPGLRHRHQRQPGRDRPLQDRHRPRPTTGIDIYRLGYYGGLRRAQGRDGRPSATLPQTQPACLTDDRRRGLIDCGNWAVSASWAVPADAVSGIYIARLVRDGHAAARATSSSSCATTTGGSDLLFQTSDTTWQAYNQLRRQQPLRRRTRHADRPRLQGQLQPAVHDARGTTPEDWVFNAEYPMVRWLERNGYDVSYFTGVDTDRRGARAPRAQGLPVGRPRRVLVGRAARQRRGGARRRACTSPSSAATRSSGRRAGRPASTARRRRYRTLVCYKETHAERQDRPGDPTVWTGTWRDPRVSPPATAAQPGERAHRHDLHGQLRRRHAHRRCPAADGRLRFWRNTSVATLPPGETATLGRPARSATSGTRISTTASARRARSGCRRTTVDGVGCLQDYGSTYGPGTATHRLTLYRARERRARLRRGHGAVVVGPRRRPRPRQRRRADPRMQQATVNLLRRHGRAARDAAGRPRARRRPRPTRSRPTADDHRARRRRDRAGGGPSRSPARPPTPGGVVGGGRGLGRRRRDLAPAPRARRAGPTPGRPTALGRVDDPEPRAVDDSGNLETPRRGVTVDGRRRRTCPVHASGSDRDAGRLERTTPSAVELGVKFRADVDGLHHRAPLLQGRRRTPARTSATSGPATGTLLADGHLHRRDRVGLAAGRRFATPGRDHARTRPTSPPTTRRRATTPSTTATSRTRRRQPAAARPRRRRRTAPNGVYAYGAGGASRPARSTAANYWVDVVFATERRARRHAADGHVASPRRAAPRASRTGTHVTATFSEPMDAGDDQRPRPSSCATPSSALVAGDRHLRRAGTRTATLDPDQRARPYATTYTATVKGGAGGRDGPRRQRAGRRRHAGRSRRPRRRRRRPTRARAGRSSSIAQRRQPVQPLLRRDPARRGPERLHGRRHRHGRPPRSLAGYDVVILGRDAARPPRRSTMLTDWVNGGGNLIAMRPDTQLAGLLGLTDAAGTLSERLPAGRHRAAARARASSARRSSSTARPTATRSSGATAVATLYSDATTATANPAVTLRSVGANGGQAAAFTYDLARSVVYTRQGNPAWAGPGARRDARRSAPTTCSSAAQPATPARLGRPRTRSRSRRPTSSSACWPT